MTLNGSGDVVGHPGGQIHSRVSNIYAFDDVILFAYEVPFRNSSSLARRIVSSKFFDFAVDHHVAERCLSCRELVLKSL